MVRGRVVEGAELTLNTSTLSDFDGIASMVSIWERSTDGRTWEGVTGSESQRSLQLSQAFVGNRIRARVNVVDNFGVETVVYSQATETVRNVNNKPAGRVMIRRPATRTVSSLYFKINYPSTGNISNGKNRALHMASIITYPL